MLCAFTSAVMSPPPAPEIRSPASSAPPRSAAFPSMPPSDTLVFSLVTVSFPVLKSARMFSFFPKATVLFRSKSPLSDRSSGRNALRRAKSYDLISAARLPEPSFTRMSETFTALLPEMRESASPLSSPVLRA